MNSDGVVSLRRQNPNRRPNGSFSEFQVNDISACQIEPLRGSRTNESSIIPYHGGKRFRQFLEPCVIRKAAVVSLRTGANEQMQSSYYGRRWQIWSRSRGGRRIPVGNNSVMQRLSPDPFKVGRGMLRLPKCADNVVAGRR